MEEQQKILLVDDSEMNRAILMGLLGQEYSFLEAGDGQTALNLMITVPDIDLVLLDIVMPDMDGFAVLKEMNRQHLIERLPVITISSENDSSYVEHAYQLGVTDYIGRPFDRAVVRQRVINTLRLYARYKKRMVSMFISASAVPLSASLIQMKLVPSIIFTAEYSKKPQPMPLSSVRYSWLSA